MGTKTFAMMLPVISMAACGSLTARNRAADVGLQYVQNPYQRVEGLNDFYMIRSDEEHREKILGSCRDQIAKAICLTKNNPLDTPANCQADGAARYAKPFEALYDHAPPALQSMFCSLKKLYVIGEFFGTAFGGTLLDAQGHIIGAQMGIRQSVLDQNLDLKTWATWKEQLSFGGITGSYTATPGLPYVATVTSVPGVNDFLYFVVAHEMGHMFDFANRLNKLEPTKNPPAADDPPANPAFVEGSWGSISWTNLSTPRAQNKFPYRRGLCFYECGGEFMTKTAAPEVYRGLAKSEFISSYAASNPHDDFADTLAYYLMDKNLGTTYQLSSGQGESYDVMMKLHSPVFQAKYQYIIDFLSRPSIVYP